MKTCETCKHWVRSDVESMGRCRRYPPTAPGWDRIGWWPITNETDSCGEHTGKAGRPKRDA